MDIDLKNKNISNKFKENSKNDSRKNIDQKTIENIARLKHDLCKLIVEYYGVDMGSSDNIYPNYIQRASRNIDYLIDWDKNFTNNLVKVHKQIQMPNEENKSSTLDVFDSFGFNKKMGAFNINKAIEATQKAGGKSQGRCAYYVRTYLEAGGLNTTGHPVAAFQYANGFLQQLGFKKIVIISGKNNQASWTKTNAIPGDIAVMRHGKYGHICLWTGRNWVSDFVQKNMYPYADEGTCEIFRYNG